MRFAFLALFVAAPAFAGSGDDAMATLLTACITPLETSAPLGAGLVRAEPAMETRLLDGKAARVLRTENPGIVVVAHDSGDTCEIMALGTVMSEFDAAFRTWLGGQSDYRADAGAKMTDAAPGGAYIARALDGGYVQAFIQTQPETGFVGITASRVAQSAQAEELLAK